MAIRKSQERTKKPKRSSPVSQKRRHSPAIPFGDRRSLQALLSNLPGMVYRCRNDKDWTIEFASDGVLELTGHRVSDFIQQKVSFGRHIIHPDDQESVWNDVQSTLEERRPFQLVYRIRTRTGDQKWVWEQGGGVYSPNGDLVALEGFITDITERKEAEASSQRSEANLAEAQRIVHLGSWDWDVVRNTARCSKEFFHIFGWPYDGKNFAYERFLQAVHPEDQPVVHASVQAALNENKPYSIDCRIIRADGVQRIVHTQGEVVFDETGRSVRMFGTLQDVTARKQIEDDLAVRARQQATIAELGQRALIGVELSVLMDKTVALVARVLGVEYCKILKLLPDGEALLLKAGIGWHPGLVGQATVSAGHESQAGYTLLSSEPVIVDNLRTERRFNGPPLLFDHKVVSGMSVKILGKERPYGVLGAHTVHHRKFSHDDVNFLVAVANVLAAAIERRRDEAILQEIAQGVSARTGEEFFQLVVQHLASVLGVEYALVGRVSSDAQSISTLAMWGHDTVMPNVSFDVRETPCQQVIGKDICFYADGIQQRFPNHRLLRELNVKSCIGAPLFDSTGHASGVIVAMGREPMRRQRHAETLLRIFSVRASVELERAQVEASLSQRSSAVEQAADSVFITDKDGVIEYVNPAFEKLYGYVQSEVVGKTPSLFKSGRHNQKFYQGLWNAITSGRVFRGTLINRRKGGALFYEEKSIVPIKDRDGTTTHFVSTGRDVTARRQADEARERLATILEATTDCVATFDTKGRLLYLNKAGRAMLGIGPEEVVTSMQIADCHPLWASGIVMGEGIPGAVRDGVWSGEVALLARDGCEIPVSQVVVAHKASDGTVAYLSTIARDISERKEQTAALEYQATHDALTDLPNRNLLIDRLEQAIRTGHRDHHALSLLVLDLDRFKEVNDTLGHHYGDLLLKEVGPRLRGALRESDTIARLGGDEFAVLLPTSDREGAILTAQKILESLEQPFTLGELTLDVEASIGIATFAQHGADADTILRHADVAMYMAKQASSGYALYSSEHDQHSHRRLSLMGELRHSIDRSQLFLHYQPTVDLKTGQVVGAEALCRWQHPKYGMVPPDQFIPLAEQTGFIKPLTELVIDQALAQCREWHEAGLKVSVAVNLSARSLHDAGLPDRMSRFLSRHGLAPRWLELELTESAIMDDPDRAMEILSCVSIMGIRLAIDDFGVGHSSLTYLKRLPVHDIKIDRSFVTNMSTDPDDLMIVRSIIDLGHNQGLRVIAEGVESQDTLDRLIELGCDAAQGVFVSRPIPGDEFSRWMVESRWSAPVRES